MSRMLRNLILSLLLCVLCPLVANAQVHFAESFANSVWNPNLILTTNPGFHGNLSDGKLLLSKDQGVGNGIAIVGTTFMLVGDFTVDVTASRLLAPDVSEQGIAVENLGPNLDTFFVGTNRINPDVSPGNIRWDSSSTVTFREQRIGNSLIQSYNPGSGFIVTNTNTVDPMQNAHIILFLLQEYGSTNAQLGSFSNLSITASAFTPEPQLPAFMASFALAFGGFVLVRRRLVRQH